MLFFSPQNSPLPGAGLIRYTVEQAVKVFSKAEKDDLEKIRKEIQDLNHSLNSLLPEVVEKALRNELASKQKTLEAAEKNMSNIRSIFCFIH